MNPLSVASRLFLGVWFLSLPGLVGAATIEAQGLGDLNSDMVLDIDDLERESGSPVARTQVSVSGFGTLFGVSYDYAALADFSASKLAARAEASTAGSGAISEMPVIRGRGMLMDTLTFESSTSGEYDITFSMDVAGTVSESGGHASGFASLLVGGDASGSDFGSYNTAGAHADTLTVVVTLEGDAVLDITAQLFASVSSLDAGGSASADFEGLSGDGADIMLGLPPGVHLTESESGFFDIPVAPVPLPAGLWLLLSGLLPGFVFWRRRGSLNRG